MEKHTTTTGDTTMKESERVFRLTRRDGVTYWSGPYNTAEELRFPQADIEGDEVRHLSIADAFDAAEKGVVA
jgi:hypothetical protein